MEQSGKPACIGCVAGCSAQLHCRRGQVGQLYGVCTCVAVRDGIMYSIYIYIVHIHMHARMYMHILLPLIPRFLGCSCICAPPKVEALGPKQVRLLRSRRLAGSQPNVRGYLDVRDARVEEKKEPLRSFNLCCNEQDF